MAFCARELSASKKLVKQGATPGLPFFLLWCLARSECGDVHVGDTEAICIRWG